MLRAKNKVSTQHLVGSAVDEILTLYSTKLYLNMQFPRQQKYTASPMQIQLI